MIALLLAVSQVCGVPGFQHRCPTSLPRVALITLSAKSLDLLSTEVALARGAEERNPLLRSSRARRLSLALGTASAAALACWWAESRWAWARWLKWAYAASQVLLAGRNLLVAHQCAGVCR